MIRYLLPYGDIPQNSRVIIYGAGNVGQDYVRQIKKTEYCEIVLWIDKVSDGKCVKSTEALLGIAEKDFDLVLLATLSERYIEEMRKFLLDLGIQNKKISTSTPIIEDSFAEVFVQQWDSRIGVAQFIDSLKGNQQVLRDYFLKAGGHIAYFYSLIKELCNNSDCASERKRLLAIFTNIFEQTLFSAKTELLCLRLLYLGNCFCVSFLKRFIDSIYSKDLCVEDKFFLWQDATMMYLQHSEYLYHDFFRTKKHLGKEIAEEFNLDFTRNNEKFNRTTIVVTQIMYPDYPQMKITMPIATRLISMGYDLHLVDLSVFEYDLGNSIFEPFYAPQKSAFDFQENYRDYANLYYPAGCTMRERFQDILNHISAVNPALILDISDEYSILPYYFSKLYPVIYWPHKRPSSGSYFHKIVMRNEFYISAGKKVEHPFTHEQCIEIISSFESVVSTHKYSREQFGFSEENMVLITVGIRIYSELSNALISSICKIMAEIDKLKWVIVGCSVLPYFADNYSDLVGERIIFIEYEEKLVDLLAICDVYLNPYRIGGGTSMAWACQQGLALATPKGDNAGYVFAGEEFSVAEEKDLAPYIVALAKDKELLNKNKLYMKKKVDSFNVDTAALQFKTQIDKFIDEYYSEKRGQAL